VSTYVTALDIEAVANERIDAVLATARITLPTPPTLTART
jgi:hypothetical protein